MASTSSRTPSLTPSKSPSPPLDDDCHARPDHFFCNGEIKAAEGYLNPHDDPLALRGIPVFKPTMDEFREFEQYMLRVEEWGMRSGIVKIIPPKEW